MRQAEAPYLADEMTRRAVFAEAERQLTICNACRYCEGYCAVFPALERRNVVTTRDVSFLANLCHDCRACLYACMYAPPHEFGVNPPQILAEVRRHNYRTFTPAYHLRRLVGEADRHTTVLVAVLVSLTAVAGFVAADHGFSALYRSTAPAGSPYAVMTYAAIVAGSAVAAVLSLVAMGAGAVSWWRDQGRRLREWRDLRAWWRALRYGATLRYQRGGSEGCYVHEGRTSALRRWLHYLVAYGFGLCVVSTVAAGVEQDIVGRQPPYPFWSVPVLAGLAGGIGLVVGAAGLFGVRQREDALATDEGMKRLDRAFLVTLFALGATGLAVLGTRALSIYGTILAVHLALVWSAFLLAPTAKFVHLVYRTLAIVADDLEAHPR